MLKKILGTIGSRYLIAFLNLALIFINAKVLGIEGVGMIGLIVASVNIAVIVNGILCGNTIVYFMNILTDFRSRKHRYIVFIPDTQIIRNLIPHNPFDRVTPCFILNSTNRNTGI